MDFSQVEERQKRNRALFAEVITKLERIVHCFETRERFPGFSNYIQSRMQRKRCKLCRATVSGNPSAHFEEMHFSEFQTWQGRMEARRKRRKLQQHNSQQLQETVLDKV